jgi:signal transduction histidine kinase
MGLGLAIAASIVEAHGGELRLVNREAGGLRASVVLPR